MGTKPLRGKRMRCGVVIYNRIVRNIAERNESQKYLKDKWPENLYQEVRSSSAEDALRKIEIGYPAKKWVCR
jgi:hypothetical protein